VRQGSGEKERGQASAVGDALYTSRGISRREVGWHAQERAVPDLDKVWGQASGLRYGWQRADNLRQSETWFRRSRDVTPHPPEVHKQDHTNHGDFHYTS
jgi:hypothetical protein